MESWSCACSDDVVLALIENAIWGCTSVLCMMVGGLCVLECVLGSVGERFLDHTCTLGTSYAHKQSS